MISEKMYELGAKSSVIREIFEYGKKRKAEIGADNVYDYSLGNPSVPAPESVNEAIRELTLNMNSCDLHGYTSAVGDNGTRQAIADDLNKRFGTSFGMHNFYMTCGAAASLCITFRALAEKDDEIIIFAPYFPEYKVFISSQGATPVEVKCDADTLQIDLDRFEKAITKNTKAVVVNSPNNPSGVVLSEDTVKGMCEILKRKQAEYGKPIFIISDEPYRELVYDGVKVPFLTKYYDNTIVCYSYSKSLSLPGDRIGYILVPDEVADFELIYKAVCGAGRSLGYVCAPSMMQFVIRKCVGQTGDISVYKHNRDLLVNAFNEYGFKVAKPDGAFYLFMKSPEEDAVAFCEKAKKYELLLVPSDSFGFPGYVRLSYCVSTAMIEKSLPSFKALSEEYNLI
ncbi:MAG: pyridoxal phosphate-dependent aminotransferase [Clostridia bacterium]|nr:pyridoxal phosphate-dependent aminotransferase [Clostridia bacterium]